MIRNGDIIDHQYQIVKEIGAGGIGVIYLAYHMRLCKYVVLKKMKKVRNNMVDARKEVDLLKSLHHAYLPQVYDYLWWEQDIYTVIDYIEGYDLQWYMRNGYQFDEATIVRWLKQMGEVLVYLHSQNPKVIHCDIKPANIMIDSDGNAILIDFNISILDNSTALTGMSRTYASPEQLQYASWMQRDCSQPIVVDERTDIYSLGASFYHIMTGLEPLEKNRTEYAITKLALPYSKALCRIISRMMEPDRERRVSSAAELVKKVNNIRKSTWQYRTVAGCITALVLTAAAMISVGAVGKYREIQKDRRETFVKEYNQAAHNYESGIIGAQFDKVTGILNNTGYEAYLEENPEKKAMLLYFLADYYVKKDNVAAAEQYFEQSIETKELGLVYREYAIALADDGQFTKAERMLDKADLPDEEYSMLLAQFLCDEGKYKEALEEAQKIEDTVQGEDRETLIRMEIYCCQQLGEKSMTEQYYNILNGREKK